MGALAFDEDEAAAIRAASHLLIEGGQEGIKAAATDAYEAAGQRDDLFQAALLETQIALLGTALAEYSANDQAVEDALNKVRTYFQQALQHEAAAHGRQ